MSKYKVGSKKDNHHFLITRSYKKLYNVFKDLKKHKGRIIHIIGAPGTGKSANIYYAIDDTNLNVYNVLFDLKNIDTSSKQVFNSLFKVLARDLKAKNKKDIYKKLSKYDALIIADKFHDSHFSGESSFGFSQWTDKNGIKTLYFYLLCINEYIKHRKEFKKINIVFQTAWRIHIRGKKYDLFSDFGIFSKLIKKLLMVFFEVVEISYSKREAINIVKNHIPHADEVMIKKYIKRYGLKPRFICDALENDSPVNNSL